MPTKNSSLLDNKETTGRFASIATYGDVLRESCYAEYSAARQVYSFLDDREDAPKPRFLDGCRSVAWFCRHVTTGEVRVVSNACHLRWCPLCSEAKRNYITHSVESWLSQESHPKFLTLTLKHSKAPLTHQIDHLYKCFRYLRKRSYFKRLVTGGVWFFQVKISKTDGLWHPHLHCLIGGLYVPLGWLKRAWLSTTYSSMQVDIRPVRDPHLASCEVARYAATPCKLVGLPFSCQVELVKSMHGRRLCGSWGTAKVVSLRPQRVTDKYLWENIGSWFSVLNLRKHDSNADAIWFSYTHNTPLPSGINVNYVEDFLDGLDNFQWSDYDFDQIYSQERSPP
jgi:hypothetical protein